MKRILQRIWFWALGSCLVLIGVIAFYFGEKWKIEAAVGTPYKLAYITNRIAIGTGITQAEDGEVWITNYCATNLTNYSLLHPEVMDATNIVMLHCTTNLPSKITIEWVGKIVTADTSDPYKNPFSYLRDCELGLRSDGMVVWREKK